jgi:translation initiation factor IF-3
MVKKEEFSCRINKQISQWGKITEVRIISDNVEKGIYPIEEAFKLAYDLDLDLVEVNANDKLPICKIIDYQKFLYEQKKKKKLQEKNNKANAQEIKELRFGPNTDEHDYEFKKRHAENFIKNGDKVKTLVFFKGREMNFKERGEILLLRLADELKEIAVPEFLPKMEGNRMFMMLKPKK